MNKIKFLLLSILCFPLITLALAGHTLFATHSDMAFKEVTINDLPGWQTDDPRPALRAFQTSCQEILQKDSQASVGSAFVLLAAEDWYPACHEALKLQRPSLVRARLFFESWFTPILIADKAGTPGLFTGYYLPEVKGSLTKTAVYSAPLYARPRDLISVDLGDFSPALRGRSIDGKLDPSGNSLVPYDMPRHVIDQGGLKDKAKILVWVDPVDRFFLQIQGSGAVQLTNGQTFLLGYNGKNGAHYTSIGKLLVAQGVFSADQVSMQALRRWMQTHPQQALTLMNQNEAFTFFKILPNVSPLGTEGVPLLDGRSLAVDQHVIPLGAPVWLDTTYPNPRQPSTLKPLQRLMVAQDTGGAISGVVRGDVYWGRGEDAEIIAGYMRSSGRYWLFLPRALPVEPASH